MGDQQSMIKDPHVDSTQISEIGQSKNQQSLTQQSLSPNTHSIASFRITQENLFNVFGQWLLNNFQNDVKQFTHTAQFYYTSKQYFHVGPRYHALSSCTKIVNEVQKLQKYLGKQSNDPEVPQALRNLPIKIYLVDLGKPIWSQTKKIGGNLKITVSLYYSSNYFHVDPRYQMLNFIKLVSSKISTALIAQGIQNAKKKKQPEKKRIQQKREADSSHQQESIQRVILDSDDQDEEDKKQEQKKKKIQQSKSNKIKNQELKLTSSLNQINQIGYNTPKKQQSSNKNSLFSMKKNNNFAVYELSNISTGAKSSKLELNSDSEQQEQKKQQIQDISKKIDYQNENSISLIQEQMGQLSILSLKEQFFIGNNAKKQSSNKQQSQSLSSDQQQHDFDNLEDHSNSQESQNQEEEQQAAPENAENQDILQSDSDNYNPDQNSFFQILNIISEEQLKNYFGKWLFQNFSKDIDQFAQTASFYYTSKQYFHVGPRYHALSSCTKIVNEVQKLQKLLGKQSNDPEVPQALRNLPIKIYLVDLGKTIWARTKQIGASLKTTASQYYSSNYFHVGPRYQMLDFINLISKQVRKVLIVELYEEQTQGDEFQQQELSIQLSLNSENSLV